MTVKSSDEDKLKQRIIELVNHTVGSTHVVAVSLIDTYSSHYIEESKTVLEVVVVIKKFQPRLLNYVANLNGRTVIIFAISQWVFERDIDRGFLGEAIASKLIFPYTSLYGKRYLQMQELALKKRLIIESIENLSGSYPELICHMQIKPQFFLYDTMLKRLRFFPLLTYEMSDKLEGNTLKGEEKALKSYRDALIQLDAEGLISFKNDYVTTSKEFAHQSQKPIVFITNLIKNVPRTIFTSILGVVPQMLNSITQNTQFLKNQKDNSWLQADINHNYYPVEPRKYVFVPTSDGLVSLANKGNISGFIQKVFGKEKPEKTTYEAIGGILNDVYLIKTQVNNVEHKFLVKRFREWSNFKWFPLMLWTFGTRTYAISGQTRLSKECATSEFLRLRGFNVPKILYVSTPERLVFMEYIEGENLSNSIKQLALEHRKRKTEKNFTTIETVGELFAKVHSHGMTLGDTKPENIIISKEGTAYLLDFEQATQDGNKTWDIAVFLYYAGHYLQPVQDNETAEGLTEAFIKGYLRGGGQLKTIKKSTSPKYTRVFSIFTMPSIMLTIINVIKKTRDPAVRHSLEVNCDG
jgi:tRNA A-37 threonylcarbamoyl transferase component Bud32